MYERLKCTYFYDEKREVLGRSALDLATKKNTEHWARLGNGCLTCKHVTCHVCGACHSGGGSGGDCVHDAELHLQAVRLINPLEFQR
jgi:hypothetical protein